MLLADPLHPTIEPPPPVLPRDAAPKLPSTAAERGRVYEVLGVAGDDALARRLAAAGVWPGVRIELLTKAPFGDPLLFRLHGYRLALRRAEAARVELRAVPDAGPAVAEARPGS